MTVYDFCSLFTGPEFQNVIVDDVDETSGTMSVFEGSASQLMASKYADVEVESIDTMFSSSNSITINICSN